MDWPSSMVMYGYGKQQGEDDDDDDGEDEDFYGYGSNGKPSTNANHAMAGAASNGHANANETNTDHGVKLDAKSGMLKPEVIDAPNASISPSAEQMKAENQRKAELLRAKLMAKRQNTPVKTLSRSDTPSKSTTATAPPLPPESKAGETNQNGNRTGEQQSDEPSSDVFGLESLLAEGRAAAEAKMKETAARHMKQERVPPTNKISSITKKVESKQAGEEQQRTEPELNIKQPETNATINQPPNLSDAYYADLPIWLEVTGYHDVEYRNSKLHTYKERRALEEEVARIQKRLQKLREAEQATIEQLRSTPARPTPAPPPQSVPALPTLMPTMDSAVAQQTQPANKSTMNGIKRAHSPEPVPVEKNVRRRGEEPTGFRIRGANDSPETRVPRRASPTGLERRISYPDAHRRNSFDDNHYRGIDNRSRDPSLERRQMNYRRDSEMPAAAARPPYERDRYDPRGATRELFDSHGRASFSSVNRPDPRGGGGGAAAGGLRDYGSQYRRSAGLDLRKGGVRYFMIKSWNHENVSTAMRDSLWATQEKNEQILTQAFNTSRHVILLFSVNKSMAFQGYALMTSPPDPALPKPPFCTKLHWSTSAAFSLRWLATTSVHFRHVGHLKNDLNVDDQGKAMAVLVGKDGQEISPEAGMGLVWILDEVEEEEGMRAGGGSGVGPGNGW